MDRATRERLGIKLTTIKQTAAPMATVDPVPAAKPEPPKTKRKWSSNRKALKQSTRLPHGSRFDIAYDASTISWSGTLTIGGTEQSLVGTAGSLFKLLVGLDGKYRQSLESTKQPE